MEGYNPTNLTGVHFPRLRDNQNLVKTVPGRDPPYPGSYLLPKKAYFQSRKPPLSVGP